MECDVYQDDDDTVFPPKLTALKCESIAPPEPEWYHGFLDRAEAELLLCKQDPGAYLVRVSIPNNNQPIKYVLSVKTTIGFHHFKITTILGEYYISIYKFPTLGSIIGYFSEVSPLLAGLYLASPLSPKRAVPREKRLKAKASYQPPSGDDNQEVLSFKKGDTFITDDILEGDDSSWVRGRKEGSGKSGLIMRVLVQEQQQEEDLYKYEWFHGRISDSTAKDILEHEEEGRFVLAKNNNVYTMHIKSGRGPDDCKTTHIYPRSDGCFLMGSNSHESLRECIDVQGKTYPTLSPVKRNTVRSAIYDGSAKPFRDNRIQARWRTTNGKDWRLVYIRFDPDGETVELRSTDKKGLWVKTEKVLPLKECRVYEVDTSVCNLPATSYCLQIVVTGLNKVTQTHFLEVDSAHTSQELQGQFEGLPDSGPVKPGKRVKNLRIKVCHVDSRVNLPGPFFCQVGFDGSTVQRTPDCQSPDKLCWNSSLNCRPRNLDKSNQFEVKLCYYKNKKPCEVDAATVALETLSSMEHRTLYSTLPLKSQSGQVVKLKLELYYREHVVLKPACYRDLVDELQKNKYRSLKVLRDLHWAQESRETLASVLLTIYTKTKVYLIKELVSFDVARFPDDDKSSVFRDNTLTTSLIVALLNSPPCCFYWDNVFARIQADINICSKGRESMCEEKRNDIIEQDKSRILEALTQSVEEMPGIIRSLLKHILSELASRWPEHPIIQSAVILNLMFTRFYIHRMAYPRPHDLAELQPAAAAALSAAAKKWKRFDIACYVSAIRSYPDTSHLITPPQEELGALNADHCAHLLHLIRSNMEPSPDRPSPDHQPLESVVEQVLLLENCD